ncbi:unnamed protein product, partial [Hapterophycus canaliculatus]
MSLLALRSSHRGVRLHTFEPEDRAYTATPTKIGGHCFDHIRNGLTVTWRRSLNRSVTPKDIRSGNSSMHGRKGDGRGSADVGETSISPAGETSAAYATMLDPSMGRFGGLGGVVLKLRSQARTEMSRTIEALLPPPLYACLEELPPDTLARQVDTFPAAAAVPWQQQQQQQQQQHRHTYGPQWPAVAHGGEVVDLTVTPQDSFAGGAGGTPAARTKRGPGVLPYRGITATATGHSGALMAILLSKLANSGGSGGRGDGGDPSAAGSSRAAAPEAAASAPDGYSSGSGHGGVVYDVAPTSPGAVAVSPIDALRHSVDGIAQGLDDVATGSSDRSAVFGGGRDSGSWAWKARVEQTPRYSKLRRYDFVRELGSGSHGTVLLVRKRNGGGGGGRRSGISSANTARGGGSSHRTFGSGNSGNRNGDDFAGSSSSSSSSSSEEAGALRVLKESQFLPEAVNEARLLLLAAGGGGGGGG